MSEMIERVARAMAVVDKMDDGRFEYLLPHARAAIEAMRKPTDAMLTSAGDDYWDAEIHWRRMIDTALTHADGKPTDA